MSVRVMAEVWDCADLTDPTQVAVMQRLANHADDNGRNCFPSIAHLALKTRYSERTVQRVIAQLEAAGFIAVERGSGRGNESNYTINVEKLKGRQHDTLSETKRVTPKRRKGVTETKKGDIGAAPLFEGNVRETSTETSTPQPPSAAADGGAKGSYENLPHGNPKDDAIDAAVKRVMDGCGFTANRLRRKLRVVVMRRVELCEVPDEVADRMIAAWKHQEKNCDLLSKKERAAPFFEEGFWLNWRRLHWNPVAVREENERAGARVGSWG